MPISEHLASEYASNSKEKRALDIVLASSIGVFALFGGGVVAASMATIYRINPLFTQKRVGMSGEPISVVKLRTMDNNGKILGLGARIRDRGIDETPQFINVALGQLSVVGYRPLLAEDINHASQRLRAHYGDNSPCNPDRWLSLREQCKPGITGPSQIMPPRPDAGSVGYLAEVVAAECDYMENATLARDMGIIARTPYSMYAGHNPTVLRAA